MSAKTYHHGDLRAALVGEGMAMLVERAADTVSLREVARRAGVSATAVYRHFPDKAALMAALANEGLARLAVAQHAAFEAKGGGVDGFSATGAAYVRFALANPELFRMIFAHHSPGDLMEGEGSDDAMSFLLDNARALAPPRHRSARLRAAMLVARAWARAADARWSRPRRRYRDRSDRRCPRDAGSGAFSLAKARAVRAVAYGIPI